MGRGRRRSIMRSRSLSPFAVSPLLRCIRRIVFHRQGLLVKMKIRVSNSRKRMVRQPNALVLISGENMLRRTPDVVLVIVVVSPRRLPVALLHTNLPTPCSHIRNHRTRTVDSPPLTLQILFSPQPPPQIIRIKERRLVGLRFLKSLHHSISLMRIIKTHQKLITNNS